MKRPNPFYLAVVIAGLLLAGKTSIHGQIVTALTGGDAGQGFAPLAVDAGSVDFDGPSTTVQGIAFTEESATINYGGTYSFTPSFGFGNDANDTNLTSILEGFVYDGAGTVYNYTNSTPSAQYVFTGLTAGQTYQLDVFTVADSDARDTNFQVIGGTTIQDTVLSTTSPQDVVYTLTPDASGDITLDWGFGGDPESNGGNAGLVSGAALTTADVPDPSTVLLMGTGACFLVISYRKLRGCA